MDLGAIPTPARIAARPKDARGYPVLAITPWEDGEPQFAVTGTARIAICAIERRCSICGTEMEPGPVWRVVAGEEADVIDAALTAGVPYANHAATVEPPGHRACMLYAAVVCPWLARPNARRSVGAAALGFEISRGDARGAGGAVVGFDDFEFRIAEYVMFRFAGLREFLPHRLGTEQHEALREAVEAEQRGIAATVVSPQAAGRASASTTKADIPVVPECPPYLLADESAAEYRHAGHLHAGRPQRVPRPEPAPQLQ